MEESDDHFKFEDAPLYKKAMQLSNLVDRIVEPIEKDDLTDTNEQEPHKEMLTHFFQASKDQMLHNALIIPAKIAGAHGAGLYDLKMENATIIRKAARELITDARGLQMSGYPAVEFLDLLRKEIDEFRILFAQWVATFNKDDYIIDRWGLFNPPGVNYDDKDPDDDLPFDPMDFLDDDDIDG